VKATALARAALVVVAGATAFGSNPPMARAAGGLGSIKGSGAASGVVAFYNPQGVLPIAAPVDLGAPDALATIATGPATFARSSAADPGDLLANPGALLQQGVPDYPEGAIPAYPYRVSASSAVGEPSAEVSPAPGLDARVHADDTGSQATSSMPALTGPAVLTVGSMTAAATTATDGSTVTTTSHSAVQGLDLLGVVRIDSIVTDLSASSDGQTAALTGGTSISGATVAGRPVTIDANGIHAQDGSTGSNLLIGSLNDVLASAGIRVTLAGPFQQAAGGTGQLSSAGLRIDLEISDRTLPVLATLRAALPPLDSPVPGAPGIEDVLALTKATHLFAVGIGRGAVSISARAAVTPVLAAPTSSAGGSSVAAAPSATGSSRPPTGVAAVPSLGAAAPAAAAAGEPPSGIGLGEGVGVIALFALLLQPLVGDRLVRGASTLLAPDGEGALCPREGR
jgi:hypothetical protein